MWGFLCFIHPQHFQVQNSGKGFEEKKAGFQFGPSPNIPESTTVCVICYCPVKSYSWSVLNCCFESLLCGSPVALHCNSTFCTCVRLCRDVYVMIIYNRLDKHTSICCMWGTWIVNYSCNMEARTKRSCHKRQPLVLLKVCCIFCRCVNFIYLNGYKAYPLSLVFNTQRFK